ncbi:hypothetical protein HDC92_004580 [Pedobacter sp. AK017]|uniref:type IX secretion system outer membrane channel protein PorV n=1 Tax=Pedobacter sp. AK017 TaxID=2723073 RepID=UPI0017FF9198|nr:type IX secretion system outer membrane channel protein PorV [Pedobacter sp. AK017]MBB5440876.1 hypothetical protein [Pedobacter sp. AK017]
MIQVLTFLVGMLMLSKTSAQSIKGTQIDGRQHNNILTAVPFLLIMPQARSGAMGNAGVALDANASAINNAAVAFLPEGTCGASVTYSPWLKSLVPDMSLSYLSGYYRLDDRNTIGASLRYFSIGNVQFTDNNQQSIGVFNPNELAFDISYARSFGPDFSLGGAVRYIHSNLFSGQTVGSAQVEAGKAIAVDISGLYKREGLFFNEPVIWSAGINLSNIGTKIAYSASNVTYFLPANFRIGGAATFLRNDNRFIVALDLDKLMVPTQPIYDQDAKISKGKDPNRSVPAGIIGSFTDAPGGFSEELKEINISTGVEYSYKNTFALRAGYNYQSPEKGNSTYFTLGAGFKYNVLSFDLAYLAGSTTNNPMANTLRVGIQARFGQKLDQQK